METVAIIPAYNAAQFLKYVISKTRAHVEKIVVVDDGSADETKEVLADIGIGEEGITILAHKKNQGKGKAIQTAIRHIKGSRTRPDLVLFIDADGEHDPDDIPAFKKALDSADFVIGKRSSYRNLKRRMLNKWMAWWVRQIVPAAHDPSCGFRGLRWELLKRLELTSSDFSIDIEMILEVAKGGASIASIPISDTSHAGSTVRRADFIRINNYFDRWVLRNSKELPLGMGKRFFLMTAAKVGASVGSLLNGAGEVD